VMLERGIGDMVVGVCCGSAPGLPAGPVRSLGFHHGPRNLASADEMTMFSLMA